ncbi:MAG: Hsp20/alpha crystallin family protein [Treponema sp.]
MNKAMANYDGGRSMLDVLFDDFGRTMLGKDIMKNDVRISPAVDVRETEKGYVMEVDLPGYSEKDININMQDRVLTLSCKKDSTEEKKEGGYLIKERNTSEFKRRFNFSDDIDEKAISAVFENGVLEVSIPKKAETKPFQIEVKRKA